MMAKVFLCIWLAALVWAVAATPAPRRGDETHGPRPAPTSCPTAAVSCPDVGTPGQPITFTANVSGADAAVTPTYKWAVQGSRIRGGQGTPSITVEPPAHGGTVVATVEVGGYDTACDVSANCTTNVIVEPVSRKIDAYGVVAVGDEKQRLDNFMGELQKDPSAQGYLVCYGGRRSRASEAQRRCDRAKNFLVVSRDVAASRVVTVDAGYREKPTVELWLVPSGVTPPRPTPTVDPSEVRPAPKPRSPRRRGRR